MRVVLATGLFAVGVELPCAYMKEHAKSLLIMVVPTMAFGWVVVSGTRLHLHHPPRQHIFLSYSGLACTLPWSRRSLGTLHCRLPHSNRSSYLCNHHPFVSYFPNLNLVFTRSSV
jgi:hypothetical protein